MSIGITKFSDILKKIGIWIVGILTLISSFFLSVNSILHTTAVRKIDEGKGVTTIVYNIKEQLESVIYYNDSMIVNIIMLVLSIALCFIIIAKVTKIRTRYSIAFIFVWTFVLGIIWVISSQSSPTEDSALVTGASQSFAKNDFSVLKNDRYFKNYSFQLGYVLFNELIIRFVSVFKEPKTLMFLEILNAFFLATINVFIIMIINKIFADRRVTTLTTFILALSTAPIISCSFIYGVYPGMCFAVIALYCEIKYFKDNKIVFGILSILSITLAVMLKSNYLIWLVAIVLIAIVLLFGRKKYIFDGLFIVLAITCSMLIQPIVKSSYEHRSGVDLGDSVPYTSWIAMGLNETDLAPGWYNYGFTLANFENNNFNSSKASADSKKEINKRIKYFASHPQYTDDFFYLKITSQWNDTAYESIWNNQVRGQYKDKNAFAKWVCGKGEMKTRKYMDFYAQLVFFAFCIGCVFALRRKNFYAMILPLIFLGGFIYQLISEGKSQYIIPYFIVMCGFCAYGIVELYDKIKQRFKHKFFKKLFLK